MWSKEGKEGRGKKGLMCVWSPSRHTCNIAVSFGVEPQRCRLATPIGPVSMLRNRLDPNPYMRSIALETPLQRAVFSYQRGCAKVEDMGDVAMFVSVITRLSSTRL